MKTTLRKGLLPAVMAGLVTVIMAGCGSDDRPAEHPLDLAAASGHDENDGHDHAAHASVTTGPSDEQGGLDWCVEHSVPESVCTICNPSLIAGYMQVGDWCTEHGLPESNCRLCNPRLVFPQEEILKERTLEAARHDISVSLYFRPNAAICATDGALIQFASAVTGERAGISVQSVYETKNDAMIDAAAEVVFDESETYAVTTTVAALVSRWLVSPGDVVEKGEPLAVLQSPEIAELRSELVTAQAGYELERKELDRRSEMRRLDLISQADFDQQAARTEQARAEYVSARGLLLSAGLGEDDLNDIIERDGIFNSFMLRAPAAGLLAERTAQLGELLEPGRVLALVANPDAMWIEARLSDEQLRAVKPGQTLVFEPDGRGANRVGGEIIWISRILDAHTRTGTVRARVLDPHHRLQAREFGRAKIVRPGDGKAVLVPRDAVQWEGCCNVVFVHETDQRYRPRKVEVQDADGPFYQVLSGLEPGEQVVVNGAFLLKTELKKTSIGAGCCGLDPAG